MMGTRERILARAMAGPYPGHGGGRFDQFRRGAGPFDRPGGFHRRSYGAGPPVRTFTIRHDGGHVVIEAID
jgi:hypothetical protein